MFEFFLVVTPSQTGTREKNIVYSKKQMTSYAWFPTEISLSSVEPPQPAHGKWIPVLMFHCNQPHGYPPPAVPVTDAWFDPTDHAKGGYNYKSFGNVMTNSCITGFNSISQDPQLFPPPPSMCTYLWVLWRKLNQGAKHDTVISYLSTTLGKGDPRANYSLPMNFVNTYTCEASISGAMPCAVDAKYKWYGQYTQDWSDQFYLNVYLDFIGDIMMGQNTWGTPYFVLSSIALVAGMVTPLWGNYPGLAANETILLANQDRQPFTCSSMNGSPLMQEILTIQVGNTWNSNAKGMFSSTEALVPGYGPPIWVPQSNAARFCRQY